MKGTQVAALHHANLQQRHQQPKQLKQQKWQPAIVQSRSLHKVCCTTAVVSLSTMMTGVTSVAVVTDLTNTAAAAAAVGSVNSVT
jgi:hypothetical protein